MRRCRDAHRKHAAHSDNSWPLARDGVSKASAPAKRMGARATAAFTCAILGKKLRPAVDTTPNSNKFRWLRCFLPVAELHQARRTARRHLWAHPNERGGC